jgi:DNA-directed RNA polymerase sigma subunit (sigma70/sigma32)
MAENPVPLRELGVKYHISREIIRQIQVQITRDIKKWLEEEIPDFEEQYSDY